MIDEDRRYTLLDDVNPNDFPFEIDDLSAVNEAMPDGYHWCMTAFDGETRLHLLGNDTFTNDL